MANSDPEGQPELIPVTDDNFRYLLIPELIPVTDDNFFFFLAIKLCYFYNILLLFSVGETLHYRQRK